MKWVISFLLVLFMVPAAFAGEDPYIAIVGNDCVDGTLPAVGPLCVEGVANTFYFSPKHLQFMYDQSVQADPRDQVFPPVCEEAEDFIPSRGFGLVQPACEKFISQFPLNQPEICDTEGGRGEPNALVGSAGGRFEWWIRLPKMPSGEINICIQCGVLKPNEFAHLGSQAVLLCAAETGERIGLGFCTRQYTFPGTPPIIQAALPRITAIAFPGPFSLGFAPFHLTAYKNPGTYNLTLGTPVPPATKGPMTNSAALQVLDGTVNSRVLLKSCMDKCVIAKIPVDNQINALGETEADLLAGDLIYIKLQIPAGNTVDVYCHSQSAKIMGIGESPF